MSLKNIFGIFSEKYKAPSICESCGDEFVCGATLKGCWCTDIEISDAARQKLKRKFRKCLCRKCLEKYSASKT